MKRRIVNEKVSMSDYIQPDIPEELNEYANDLRMLNGIPLTYLIPEGEELPEESIRFFSVDINWTDSLVDGAFSLGRQCLRDNRMDKAVLKKSNDSLTASTTKRFRNMHQNHRNILAAENRVDLTNTVEQVSGFIMRSRMVKQLPGLKLFGYDKDKKKLAILRSVCVAEDTKLCIFAGKINSIIIEEQATELMFGSSDCTVNENNISRSIDLRSALDSEEFGKRKGSLCIDSYTDKNGRLHASDLSKAIEENLKKAGSLDSEKITPARFAFEMIAVAHRVEFTANEEGK